MAPKDDPYKEKNDAAEECRRLRKMSAPEDGVLSLVAADGGTCRDVPLAKSQDNEAATDEKEGYPEAEAKEAEASEVPVAPTSVIYTPAEDAPEFQTDALPVLQGHLSKRSTGQKRWAMANAFKLGGWGKRFYMLRDMHLLWWEQKEHAASTEAARADGGAQCKGVINFLDTPMTLEVLNSTAGGFLLRPDDGAGVKRVYEFDVKESEHSSEEWMATLHAHIDHAARIRAQNSEKKDGDSSLNYSIPADPAA